MEQTSEAVVTHDLATGRVPFRRSRSGGRARVLVEHTSETVTTQHRAGLDDGKVIEQLSLCGPLSARREFAPGGAVSPALSRRPTLPWRLCLVSSGGRSDYAKPKRVFVGLD